MNKRFQIERATKTRINARIALFGPSGSGKTYTALAIAQGMAPAGAEFARVLVIDTENRSSERYAGIWPFDVLELPNYSPGTYADALDYVAGLDDPYDVLIVDSLSHAWAGAGGALEQVDQAKRNYGNNKFAGWADVTPLHNRMVESLLRTPCHLIVTMRSKTAYEIEEDGGRKRPVKIGLAPVQREGMEYEFDLVGDLTISHELSVTKTRYAGLQVNGTDLDQVMITKPGEVFGAAILRWLNDGEDPMVRRRRQQAERAERRREAILEAVGKAKAGLSGLRQKLGTEAPALLAGWEAALAAVEADPCDEGEEVLGDIARSLKQQNGARMRAYHTALLDGSLDWLQEQELARHTWARHWSAAAVGAACRAGTDPDEAGGQWWLERADDTDRWELVHAAHGLAMEERHQVVRERVAGWIERHHLGSDVPFADDDIPDFGGGEGDDHHEGDDEPEPCIGPATGDVSPAWAWMFDEDYAGHMPPWLGPIVDALGRCEHDPWLDRLGARLQHAVDAALPVDVALDHSDVRKAREVMGHRWPWPPRSREWLAVLAHDAAWVGGSNDVSAEELHADVDRWVEGLGEGDVGTAIDTLEAAPVKMRPRLVSGWLDAWRRAPAPAAKPAPESKQPYVEPPMHEQIYPSASRYAGD